jgi:hypothetical protein
MDWRKFPILVEWRTLPPPPVYPLAPLEAVELGARSFPSTGGPTLLTLDDPDELAEPDRVLH